MVGILAFPLGLFLFSIAVVLAFKLGECVAVDSRLDFMGLSVFAWILYIFVFVHFGSKIFSYAFKLDDNKTYSHANVTVAESNSGTVRPVYLSQRERFATGIGSLVGLLCIALGVYVAFFYYEKSFVYNIGQAAQLYYPLFSGLRAIPLWFWDIIMYIGSLIF